MNLLILYDSVYGSTEEIACWIEERISEKEGITATTSRVNVAPRLDAFDAILLGSPIYRDDRILPAMSTYVQENAEALLDKEVGIFVVSLDPVGALFFGRLIGGVSYLQPFADLFIASPIYGRVLGGELIPSRLSDEDRESLLGFYQEVKGLEDIPNRYSMDKPKVWEFVDCFLQLVKCE